MKSVRMISLITIKKVHEINILILINTSMFTIFVGFIYERVLKCKYIKYINIYLHKSF